MTKSKKIWYGIIAIVPVVLIAVLMIAYFTFFFSMFMNIPNGGNEPPKGLFIFLPIFFGLFILVGIVAIVGLILYIMHIVNNKKLTENERLIWIILLLMVTILAKPIYWYMKIWKEDSN